jgi:hypothetical protein
MSRLVDRSPLLLLSLLLPLAACAKPDGSAIPPAPPTGVGQSGGADGAGETAADRRDDAIPDVGGDAVVQRIVQLGHTDNQVGALLTELTTTFGPRLTGSHNLMGAERWCRDRFRAWGLTAELERWGEVAVGFDRGPWSGRIVGETPVELTFTTPAWTPGAFGPVRGAAVAYPTSTKALAAGGDTWEGAWVLRPRKTGIPDKLEEKIDAGLHAKGIAGFVTRARDDEGLVHTSGRSSVTWDELPADPKVVLQAAQYDQIVARLDAHEPVQLEFSIDNRLFRGPVPLHNVIAEIPGTDKADEFVVVGGHIDSWDGAMGANDNGTGIATTMEAARLLHAAGAKPRRTIQFMLWSGEEQGLLGSRGYVDAHPEQMDKISAVLVHDGGTNYLSGLAVTPEMMPQMQQVVAPLTKLAPADRPFALTETTSLRPGGSDHSSFIDKGVPGFFWGQEGRSDYDFVHHTQHDNLDNVIDEYQRHSAMVVAIAAYQLANLDELLDRRNSAPVPRRRMGVSFSGTKVDSVASDGVAKKAGLKPGDVVVEVEGKAVEGRWGAAKAVQDGGPVKKVTVERGGKRLELTLDWSDDPGEAERQARRSARGPKGGE